MIEQMENFFEQEYRRTQLYLLAEREERFHSSKSEVVWNAVQRCLGVFEFVDIQTGEYSKIEPIYEFYKEKLVKLLDERE